MGTFDRRKAPWLPGGCRHRGFTLLENMARMGLKGPEMARCLGTTPEALSSYMQRQGITMAELRGEEHGGS